MIKDHTQIRSELENKLMVDTYRYFETVKFTNTC